MSGSGVLRRSVSGARLASPGGAGVEGVTRDVSKSKVQRAWTINQGEVSHQIITELTFYRLNNHRGQLGSCSSDLNYM